IDSGVNIKLGYYYNGSIELSVNPNISNENIIDAYNFYDTSTNQRFDFNSKI
ncbi:924_t:CDS:1, partial [Entrophospora sp. SA101]